MQLFDSVGGSQSGMNDSDEIQYDHLLSETTTPITYYVPAASVYYIPVLPVLCIQYHSNATSHSLLVTQALALNNRGCKI